MVVLPEALSKFKHMSEDEFKAILSLMPTKQL
jgi:hypothetical protein